MNIKSMDKQWQIEEDARTLARYQEIMSDSSRKAKAMKEANKQVIALEKKLKSLKAVNTKTKRK